MFSNSDHFLASTFSVAACDKENCYSGYSVYHVELIAAIRNFQTLFRRRLLFSSWSVGNYEYERTPTDSIHTL